MQCFETYEDLPDYAHNCVLVIGNFDGVHLGHQALLKTGRNIAKSLQKPLAVLTFEPHPTRLFRPDEPPSRITPKSLKAKRLALSGVDYLFSLPFTWEFASQTAQSFIQNILTSGLKPAHIVIGYDFKFGQLRQGTPDTLIDAGLPLTLVDEVKANNGENFSSSRIRQLLRHGKISEANEILGWEWELHGEVFKGDQRGRDIGYPTANMKLNDIIHPSYGVYAVMARLEGEKNWMMGATNIGIRPMFKVKTAQIETFIFDFDREIYDHILHVRPVKKLRGEAKFSSIDGLIDQIKQDCMQSKDILDKYLTATP